MEPKCPNCHVVIKPTDYFCYNCGTNLKPAPPSTTLVDQIILYSKSVLIPPFGVIWAVKYLRQGDDKSKIVGIIAILLTIISLILSIIFFNNFMKSLNTQLNSQLDSFQY